MPIAGAQTTKEKQLSRSLLAGGPSSRPLLFSTLILVCCALAFSACGGKSSKLGALGAAATTGTDTTGGGANEPQNASAGPIADYTPTGTILADNGFRPQTDGFSFQNYGNEVQPQNMTPAEVENLFGSQVCVSGTGASCQLMPPAQQWMDNENARMAGGHCMGFSVTAERLYSGNTKPDVFGGSAIDSLALQGNTGLQSTIAENWTFQDLPSVQSAQVKGTPSQVLDKLISTLKDKSEYYTVAIFKSDGTGGHAITPYAVEDLGGGKYNILVYDNNFPKVTRAIAVDRNADTWQYEGGPNPSDTSELYQGNAQTTSLSLFPMSPGLSQQPCPFCNGQNLGSSGAAAGSVLGASQQYNEITLTGDPADHAHLTITDEQGNQTGFVNGQMVNDIPGAQVKENLANQDWKEAPEPTYQLPVNTKVTVTIDGSALSKSDNETLDLVGPGDYSSVQDIKVDPGQKDTVTFYGDGSGFTYQTDPGQSESPVLTTGVQGKSADYVFGVKSVNVSGGSKIDVYLDQKQEQLNIDTAGTGGAADYVVSVHREDGNGSADWTSKEALNLHSGEIAHLDYSTSSDSSQPLKMDVGQDNGPSRTVQIPVG